ncbi:MAG TPA: radical SAM protein [Candidatus Aminicenantes bacterium]|nr:radical SAM protein [Candidatus Aminicenantes bacterium]
MEMDEAALTAIKERNLRLIASGYEAGSTRLRSLPASLYVDVTKKCNLRCPSCFRSAPEHAGADWPEIDFPLFERIADELFPAACRVILSGGGESLLHPDFSRMLELCLRYRARPLLYTNASTLTSATVTLLARAGACLGVSIDGAAAATFERLRFPLKWERMLQALDLIRTIGREVNNEDFYPYLGVVLQNDNLHELPLFIDLARDHGMEQVKFSLLIPYYPLLRDKVPSARDLERELVKALEKANDLGIYVYAPVQGNTEFSGRLQELLDVNGSLPFRIQRNNPDRFVQYPRFASPACQIPWAECLITADGKVNLGCCSSHELGDLRRKPFAAVWNNRKYRKLRETVNGRRPLLPCRKGVCPFR